MAVEVHLEPADMAPFYPEPCSLCRTPTRHWYVPNDVALCEPCAETATPEQIPTKKEWCAKERAIRQAGTNA
jgi:hypothetical protein